MSVLFWILFGLSLFAIAAYVYQTAAPDWTAVGGAAAFSLVWLGLALALA